MTAHAPRTAKRIRDLGPFVRSLREMRTQAGSVFPAGSVFRVVGAWRGRLALRRIGSQRSIRQVYPGDVERYVRPARRALDAGGATP